MLYRTIITILIPAFLIYATLSVTAPTAAYASEANTQFEPEKVEPPAIEAAQPEGSKGSGLWWKILLGIAVAGGIAAAAGGGSSSGGSSGDGTTGGGSTGGVTASW